MAVIKISIINASTVLTDAQVSKVVPALQTQVHRDFYPAWGIDADLTFVPKGSKPVKGTWQLVILDNSDQAGALGYHDLTKDGLPLGKVFRKRIEEHFGWGKTVGQIRQTVYRGLKKVDQQFKLTMTASNLVRIARMPFAVPQGALQ